MPWPIHGHEVTRGYFRALTRPRDNVKVELRPTYFPGQHREWPRPRRVARPTWGFFEQLYDKHTEELK
jgi:hypothetical protein